MNERFVTKKFVNLTDEELARCSALFSEHYGKYSGKGGGFAKGQPIKMSPNRYKSLYGDRQNIFISMCYDESGDLLGHAIFLRKEIEGKGLCSWVVQLVVHSRYRNRKIGSRLLLSAWGFSNFYPELELSNKNPALDIYAKRMGELESGYEWLAFTFRSQKMSWTTEKFNKFIEFSETQLKEAYSRMDMPRQPWTKGTANEVDFILDRVELEPDARILDLGCGQGRHVVELARRGFTNVTGVDFAEKNLESARAAALEKKVCCNFVEGDARIFKTGTKYDCVLCLYDVIGSFRNLDDNVRILKNIKLLLADGGKAVVSVMNFALTSKIAKHKVSLSKNPQALLALPPSETMKSTGNIFNPEYFLINKDDGLVYRKEQFSGDDFVLAEYVVADKRYKASEIKELAESVGLKVVETRFVSAGAWDKPLKSIDEHAKEILLVLENR